MPTLSLSQGRVALVDAVDYVDLAAFHWRFARNAYAVRYTTINDQRKTIFLQREIMQRILNGPIPIGLQVDHLNRDRLDNRRANLRLATRSQNQANKAPGQVNNTSGYKGVSAHDTAFEARIRVNREGLYLGRYNDPVTAARVYDAATRLFNGDFAGLNFPDVPPSPEIVERLLLFLKRRPERIAALQRAGRWHMEAVVVGR